MAQSLLVYKDPLTNLPFGIGKPSILTLRYWEGGQPHRIHWLENSHLGVSKNRGCKTPKMDGLFHGKPYEQMDDLGGFSHYFRKHFWG